MVFKGRTVFVFVLLAMFASSLLTITFFDPTVPADKTSQPVNESTAAPQAGGMTTDDIKKLETTFGIIHNQYVSEIDHDKLIDGAINGMLSATGDPFSSYMNPQEAKQFMENVDASFDGIGVQITVRDGNVTLEYAPIKGSPAEKAGLRINDVISAVNGEKLEGLTLNQVVAKIRGVKGTQAKLSILRSGTSEAVNIIVVRDEIQRETVVAEMVTPEIGKIEIRQFSVRSVDEFNAALVNLEGKGMKSLIIDLRNNPGGLLEKVKLIAQPFIEKGKVIVQTADRSGKQYPSMSELKEPARKYPIAVLINKGSASAAEILAAALKQSANSKLIGETTYGKGTVQDLFDKQLGDGSNLKVTVNKWLTPNGTWIHQKGIDPDYRIVEPDYFNVPPLSKKTTLKRDMNNDDVKNLQIMLTGLGFNPARTDGYYNEETVLAVNAFQKSLNLPATGEADLDTMNKLEKEIIAHIKDPKNDTQLTAAISLLQNSLPLH